MEIAKHWRLKAQRYRLEGSTCPDLRPGQLPAPPGLPGLRRTSEVDGGLRTIGNTGV